MSEEYYDEVLNIKTGGNQRGFSSSFHYHRYEPTPYGALETLFAQYELNSSDRVVDFGCGKGRLNFYINYLFQSTVVGVEMNETYYEESVENQKSYLKKFRNNKDKIHFHCCLAEKYEIAPEDNRFYFFNPFTVPIFWKVINNILLSVEKSYREIDLVLYYPSEDYIYFLENNTSFELYKEVILPDLYVQNPNERFLIYRLV
jgi:SAM-dependent methyltransferase